mgnify:CR=1 FL=1
MKQFLTYTLSSLLISTNLLTGQNHTNENDNENQLQQQQPILMNQIINDMIQFNRHIMQDLEQIHEKRENNIQQFHDDLNALHKKHEQNRTQLKDEINQLHNEREQHRQQIHDDLDDLHNRHIQIHNDLDQLHNEREQHRQQIHDDLNDLHNQHIQIHNDLDHLDKQLKERHEEFQQRQQQLDKELKQSQEELDQLRNQIKDDLDESTNRQQKLKQDLSQLFDDDQLKDVLDHISTKDKTNKQIADEITQHIHHVQTTGDDLLESMLNRANNKEDFIAHLLSPNLSSNEAHKVAREILNKHLNSAQTIQEVKDRLKQYGISSSDDILNQAINHAHNKREAIEAVLRTKFNHDKAHLLAGIIAKAQTHKANIMDLIHHQLNHASTDLLKAEHDAHKARRDAKSILDPIINRPTLLDRIEQNKRRTGPLESRHNLNQHDDLNDSHFDKVLKQIGNHDSKSPDKALDPHRSKIMNDDGNISLPAAGQVFKQHWGILSLIAIASGGALVVSQIKRKKTN